MLWEFLRDTGLTIFVSGGLWLLVMNKVLRRRLNRADARRLQTIGDGMMLAGASLAVIAMLVGYFVSGEGHRKPRLVKHMS
jgi:hypothetical protein